MTYKINKTDGSLLAEVVDGTIDQIASDLTLVGKNVAGYGEFINENFVKILENFASTSEPNNPIMGQIWFDSAQNRLKVYDGNGFRIGSGPIVTGTPPLNLVQGDLWIDSAENQLYFYDGTDLQLAGPIYKDSQGLSGLTVESIYDSAGALRTVVYLWVAQTLLGIFSKYTFDFQPRVTIPGFNGTIKPGFNAGTLSNMKFHVRSTSSDAIANSLGQLKTADDFMLTSGNTSTNGTVTITNALPLRLGASQNYEIAADTAAFKITSNNSGQDYAIRIKNGSGVTKDAITVKSITERIGIFQPSPQASLDVNGTIKTAGLYVTGAEYKSYSTITFNSVSASSIVSGLVYRILTSGDTDFTLIGAVSSTPGTVFVATGTISGTGTVSSAYFTEVGLRYIIDTTIAPGVIYLPPSPNVGDTVTFVDGSTAGLSLNDVTIARNGVLKINGITSNLAVDQDGAAFTLLYTGSNRGWVYDKVTV